MFGRIGITNILHVKFRRRPPANRLPIKMWIIKNRISESIIKLTGSGFDFLVDSDAAEKEFSMPLEIEFSMPLEREREFSMPLEREREFSMPLERENSVCL